MSKWKWVNEWMSRLVNANKEQRIGKWK